jgi:lysyl-tRNA synthetase class 1
MEWADELAAKVAGRQVVNDSKTPSGTVHVGSLRGPVILDVITRALRAHGVETTLLYGVDDMDPMDAQALLTPDAVDHEMGRPLAHVPDQSGDCHASYARHHAQTFIDTFAGLGIRPDRYYWMSDIYPTGQLDPFIRTALDRADVVREVYRRVANVQHPDTWHPVQVVCEVCGKVGTTIVTRWDGERVFYECRPELVTWARGCGASGWISPFGGTGKLGWNLEWAAQWSLFGVTIEPCGKDLATAGAHGPNRRHRREVFERDRRSTCLRVPQHRRSQDVDPRGRGAAAIGSSRSCRPSSSASSSCDPANQAIEFDPEGSDAIPRLFDEFDRLAAATAGREVKGELPAGYEAVFRYSLFDAAADVAAEAAAFRPDFSHLALLAQVPGVDVLARVEAEKGALPTEVDDRRGAPGGRAWLARTYAPERARSSCATRCRRRPSPSARTSASTRALAWRPNARRRERRGLAGPHLLDRSRSRTAGRSGFRRDLPGVPRSDQRTASGLAAGQPRRRLRDRPTSSGRWLERPRR